MLKILLGLPIFFAGAVVGGKFYTEYKIEESLDKVVEMASMFADVSYGNATINFDGSFSLTDLRVSEIESSNEFSIDEIKFNSSSNWIFLAQVHKTSEEKMRAWIEDQPDKISLNINNFNFASDHEDWDSGVMVAGCGNINESGSHALTDLGYDRINVDFDMNIDLTNKAESTIKLLTKADEIGYLDIVYNMNFSDFDLTSMGAGAVPELKSIVFQSSQDQHFSQNNIQYCAKQMNLSTEEYLATVVGDPSYLKGSGLVPDQQMMDAVVAYTQGADLEVTLEPSISFSNFNQLKFYKAQDAVQLMGLTVQVGGEKLNDIVIDMDGEGFKVAKANWKDNGASSETNSTAESAKSGYHKVSLSDLNGLTGYYIKVSRKSAEPMVGKLLSARGGTVKLEQRRYGGSVTFPIENNDITKLEAYF